MFDLLIKIPTRARPDKFRSQFDKYYNMLSGELKVKFVVSMDIDDHWMNNEDMKWWLSPANGGRQNIFYYYGNSKTKVQAINADMHHHTDWKILLLASDDMTPVEKGYDKIIYDDMTKHFPDFNGALHYNDGRVGQRLITLSIMGKPMYNHFGYIYHPSYISVFCDNEFHDCVYAMNKAVYLDKVIIKHDWVDYTGKDQLHMRNESFYRQDGRTYERRKRSNFNPRLP
jgi:hypothetical protein